MHDIGDAVTLTTETRDVDGNLVDPGGIVVAVTDPSGTAVSPDPTVSPVSTGIHRAEVTVDVAGRWRYVWTSTGPDGVDHGYFDVDDDPLARLDPLATIADLEALIGSLTDEQAARAVGLIRGASAKVRAACHGQIITRVDDDSQVLRASGHRIYLPQRPVIDVTSVALVDGDTDITLTGWKWEGLDEIDLRPVLAAAGQAARRTNSNNYRVVYSHGHQPGGYVLDGVADIVANMVNRVLTSPTKVEGVTQQVAGQASLQYQQARGSSGVGVRMFQSDRDDLAELGLRARAGTVRTRVR